MATCKRCTQGTFNSEKGALSIAACKACPKGTVSISDRNLCEPCSPGSVQQRTGSVTCVSFPQGPFTPESVSMSLRACDACAKGSFWRGAVSTCTKCRPGTYQDLRCARSCNSCPERTFRDEPGVKVEAGCNACPPGSFSMPGSTACSLCKEGLYHGRAGAKSCKTGIQGTFNNSIGLANAAMCKECPKGTFSKKLKSRACGLCHVGTYQDDIG